MYYIYREGGQKDRECKRDFRVCLLGEERTSERMRERERELGSETVSSTRCLCTVKGSISLKRDINTPRRLVSAAVLSPSLSFSSSLSLSLSFSSSESLVKARTLNPEASSY